MALVVRDFMTPKLVYVEDGTRLRVALHPLIELGITSVPVLDSDHRPVGVVSLQDLVENPASASSTKPALQIEATASIDAAARRLADAAAHHLVVVDDDGRAVGMLSSLDVVRAFLQTRQLDAV